MEIKSFQAGPLLANNYLLTDNNEAVLIDCSEYKPEILEGVNLKYILLTHGHFDHILGVNETREKTGAKVLIHEKDIEQLEGNGDLMSMFGFANINKTKIDGYFNDGDVIKFGNSEIKVISTPGHTKGGVSFLVGDNLFSGDTLFRTSYGRCDLPGGDYDEIKNSIKDKLFKLDDNVTVYPGHDSMTTIGFEKENNEINI